VSWGVAVGHDSGDGGGGGGGDGGVDGDLVHVVPVQEFDAERVVELVAQAGGCLVEDVAQDGEGI